MDVTRTVKVPKAFYTLTATFGRGTHTMTWNPGTNLNPRTYLIRFTAVDTTGNRGTYGAPNAFVGRHARGVVVRLQGIDTAFTKPSYLPGELAQIHIATDEPSLTYRIFHSGPEQVVTYADNQLAGVDIGLEPVILDWSRWQSRGHTISFRVPDVPSGLYYVQFSGADGRVGYAPFVVRPTLLGMTSRVLVVLPTDTWQAYNFQDVNGERVRRHVVRRPAEPNGRLVAHLHRTRRPAALLSLRPPVPPLVLLVREDRGIHLRF